MQSTLVFGASLKPNRYSNLAIKRLLENNVNTVAFGLKTGLVDEVQIKTNLSELPKIHTVTLYLNPERQKQYYDSIIVLKPRRVIFNPGTENPEFYKLLEKHNIQVEVSCTLVLLATGQY
ncbi:CoA-binding protein [Croceitalea rosinachiae]|uniref:CoA-binding protein n=1 Tax=Croceitalea rosinachiae TaxID=3075596 RepID=A0ABU3A9Q6_9FLAO|nr:CoA-binding protein [Croceitalea sp. F388]MDT0606926.1 CoA-binding protein [Croceitalea sp. F388]